MALMILLIVLSILALNGLYWAIFWFRNRKFLAMVLASRQELPKELE